jgi:Metallo-beta-lactamase superfamily
LTGLAPPLPDEIEIDVFGPGFGECIVVHSGDGIWLVLDSCIDIRTGKPAALSYFDAIDVDPRVAVHAIVATHWHDDHVRGLADIFDASTNAALVISIALQSDEFLTLAALEESGSLIEGGSGVRELARALRICGTRRISPVWAIANREVWASRNDDVARSLRSLSPSDAEVTLALARIRRLIPQAGDTKRRIAAPVRNEASVAALATVPLLSVLLGADLEEQGHPDRGWSAVLAFETGRSRSDTFKVPHHGSANADHPAVWRELLHVEPIAVLSPWMLAGRVLPTAADIERLRERTTELHMTARAIAPGKVRVGRDPRVQKIAKNFVRHIRAADGRAGHVRVRYRGMDGEMKRTVDHFGPAFAVA